MTAPDRLKMGGLVDRERPLTFTFNGTPLRGLQGDTLASALLANNVHLVGRSFKYGRPRGIVGHGAEEPNAIVQLADGAHTLPNQRATQVELYEGLAARSVTGWPGLRFDLRRAGGIIDRLMPPGFYYKTFMQPRRLWKTYEYFLRRAAGLGDAPADPDPDFYDKLNHHCDVLVVGAGPTGLAAALEAASRGARVILADEQSEMGGSLLGERRLIDAGPALKWIVDSLASLEKLDNVTLLHRSTVFGYYDHNFLAILERRTDHLGPGGRGEPRHRLHRVRARRVILATGAIERPLVFAGNDLPGIMMASSVRTYLNRYAVAPGRRLVLFTTNDDAYRTAIDWCQAGREVVAIVDPRHEPAGGLPAQARSLGLEIIAGHAVTQALGGSHVSGVLIAPIAPGGAGLAGNARRISCDLLACSGGWNPAIHLSSQTGAKPRWSDEVIGFVPGDGGGQSRAAGAANGSFALSACLGEGFRAGAKASGDCGFGSDEPTTRVPAIEEQAEEPPIPLFRVPHRKPAGRAPAQFVDFQLDVKAGDIELAAREGYESIEHVKRYTALGFGTDQGKLGNVSGIAILAQSIGKTMAEIGTTVFRPSYTPTTFGALAGREVSHLFDPERYTPIHRWHLEHGAVWEDVGQWKRPRYFPGPGESMRDAVIRECLAVRTGVGIMDGSTLGKIDIQGPDAAEFIDRIYTNSFLKLAPGRCRYGLMLKEDGMIFDDGVTACLGENRYLMFTTTGGAATVLAWLELWHQTEWPDMRVFFTSVTDHWATAILAGPRSRDVLQKVCQDVDLSANAFRFMDWRDATIAGIRARVFRISFSGELSYEVHVPAHFGRRAWEELFAAGKDYGITPYGTETMHVLRAEKGFIIVGQDTDGSVTPFDANMGWLVEKNKPFSFIGERSLRRSACLRQDRKQLVGLKPLDTRAVIPEGAQIVTDLQQPAPMAMEGHVTSSYYSGLLQRSFALALVKDGLNRMGEIVHCPLAGGHSIAAEITGAVFYDPDGERQRV